MQVTEPQLRRIYTRASPLRIRTHLGPLNAAMLESQIDSAIRVAAFLAQLGHESGELRYFEELDHEHAFEWCALCRKLGHGHPAGEQYEGRADLGNTQPGDGVRYKGRSPIQLTGRANYRRAGAALNLDLEANPAQVETVEVGLRVAGWFWRSHGLNLIADSIPADPKRFDAITRAINGGLNGKASRDAYFALARRTLGC